MRQSHQCSSKPTKSDAVNTIVDGNISISFGNVLIFDGNVSVFFGNVLIFDGNVSIFFGNVSIFDGDIVIPDGNIVIVFGNVVIFDGNVSIFFDNVVILERANWFQPSAWIEAPFVLSLRPEETRAVAERLATELSQLQWKVGDSTLHIATTIGIASSVLQPGANLEELLEVADRDLYAKKAARSRASVPVTDRNGASRQQRR